MKLYYSKCAKGRNFGDVLSKILIEHYLKINPDWSKAEESDIVIIGSILSHLPKQYNGIVAGIGAHIATLRKDLTKAKVLAIRGPLTLETIKLNSKQNKPILADPGLLSNKLLNTEPNKIHKVGYVPHFSDKTPPPENSYIIDVTQPVLKVIEEIGQCEKIVSSSLHGIIVADSFNIPRAWRHFKTVQGKGFKFYDYNKSVLVETKLNTFQIPNYNIIVKKQEKLEEMLQCLK
jgi:pyruvyltransferase